MLRRGSARFTLVEALCAAESGAQSVSAAILPDESEPAGWVLSGVEAALPEADVLNVLVVPVQSRATPSGVVTATART